MEWRLDNAMLWRVENLLSSLRIASAPMSYRLGSRGTTGVTDDPKRALRWVPLDEENMLNIEILHEDLKSQVSKAYSPNTATHRLHPPSNPQRHPTVAVSIPKPILKPTHPSPSKIWTIEDDECEEVEEQVVETTHGREVDASCERSNAPNSTATTKRAFDSERIDDPAKRTRLSTSRLRSSKAPAIGKDGRFSPFLDGVRDRLEEFLDWLYDQGTVRPKLAQDYRDAVRLVGYEGKKFHPDDFSNIGASAAFKAFGRFLRHGVTTHSKSRLKAPEEGPWSGCPIVLGFRRWLIEKRSASEADADRWARMVQRIKYNMYPPTASEVYNGAAFAFREFDCYQNKPMEILNTYAQTQTQSKQRSTNPNPNHLVPAAPSQPHLPPHTARDRRMSLSHLVNTELDA